MAAKLENFFSFQSFLINFNKTLTLNLKKLCQKLFSRTYYGTNISINI